MENLETRAVQTMQKGIVRTNCLDSLDRTNVGQSKVGMFMLEQQLKFLKVDLHKIYGQPYVSEGGIAFMYTTDRLTDVIQRLRVMWTEMGD